MAKRMIDHWTSSTDGPDVRPETHTPAHRLDASPPSSTAAQDELENLAQSEIMLRTAIEALSPDADEIHRRLDRDKTGEASATGRNLSFRLVVAVVILVFMILALDLILTGG